MLLGTHDHTLDDKNRLTLPAKLREQLGDSVVVTRGFDGCLYAYARDEWDRRSEQLARHDDLTAEARRLRRFLFAGAAPADLDKQGRMVIPAGLLESARIGREVTVAGVYDHLEIWDRAAWRKELQTVEGSAEDVAERLANRD